MDDFPASVGVIGAGVMGQGIAQLAILHRTSVKLVDVDDATLRNAVDQIESRLDRLVEKRRLTIARRCDAGGRLQTTTDPADLADCDLIIEAAPEDLEIKVSIFEGLIPTLRADALLATNTSSLSITELGRRIGEAARLGGMHFFNPAPIQPLVEVIASDATEKHVIERLARTGERWGKTVVRAKDSPGFIVNRVARPFYLEAWRILDEGVAGVDRIDDAMRRLGGFRMGPFELLDWLGHDLSVAVTRSVWEGLGRRDRLAPVEAQKRLVEAGQVGRRSGRGAYDYSADPPTPALQFDPRPLDLPASSRETLDWFVSAATEEQGDPVERYVFGRILVSIINEAAWTLEEGVASAADIDRAMRLGTNYPLGPFEWAERIGRPLCVGLMRALAESAPDDRYRVAEPLAGADPLI